MPINRPDGRHWCDPASETPDDDGLWACTDSDCDKVWQLGDDGVWAPLEAEEG